jgi:hypothetical protein
VERRRRELAERDRPIAEQARQIAKAEQQIVDLEAEILFDVPPNRTEGSDDPQVALWVRPSVHRDCQYAGISQGLARPTPRHAN